jgi:hypothetical protein
MEFTGLYPITENAGILHGISPMPAWITSSKVPLDFFRLIRLIPMVMFQWSGKVPVGRVLPSSFILFPSYFSMNFCQCMVIGSCGFFSNGPE